LIILLSNKRAGAELTPVRDIKLKRGNHMNRTKTMKLLSVSLGVFTLFLVAAIALVASDYVIQEDGKLIQMNDDDGTPTMIAVFEMGNNNIAATEVDTQAETSRSVTKSVTFSGSPTASPS